MKILITGGRGQLAREFQSQLSPRDFEVSILTHNDLDICDRDNTIKVVSRLKPDVILNCAAYNLVDRAETDEQAAMNTNGGGVENLAIAAKLHRAFLVHYSTDYVFDGRKEDLYTEDDITNPLNVYGRSKLAGEEAVRNTFDDYLILRLSWVYGPGSQSFLLRVLGWAERGRILKITADHVSVPCYTADVVRFSMEAISKRLTGLYHLTNSGYATRYEVAKWFLERLGRDNVILPVSAASFSEPTVRPHFSVMSNHKISQALGLEIPTWKDGMERYIASQKGM